MLTAIAADAKTVSRRSHQHLQDQQDTEQRLEAHIYKTEAADGLCQT